MGILDVFRQIKETDEQKQIRQDIDQEIKEKGYITFTNFIPNSKPQKEFKIRKCKECGRSVKHTCISERYGPQDLGGMQQIRQIWAISTHKYGKIKCRGSNRRYKKQFIK